MAILTDEQSGEAGEVELLIPEVEQETRRRRRQSAVQAAVVTLAVVLITVVALVLAGVAGAGGNRNVGSGSTDGVGGNAAASSGLSNLVPNAVVGTLKPVGFPPSTGLVQLHNVSCASGVACIVVGDVMTWPTETQAAWRYEHGAWQRLAAPLWTNRDGPGPLSCPTTSFCVMASNHWDRSRGAQVHASVQLFAGGRWTEQGTPSPPRWRYDALQAVDCLSPSWCMAIGDAWNLSGRSTTYADVYDQGAWTLLSVPPSPGEVEPGLNSSLDGIACTSTTFCLAVGQAPGRHGEVATAASYDGQAWTALPVPRLPASELGRPGEIIDNNKVTILPWNQGLTGVACSALTECTTTGQFLSGSLFQVGGSFVMHFNGTSFSNELLLARGPLDGHPRGVLAGIACSSATRCASYEDGTDVLFDRFFSPRPVAAVQVDGVGWFTSAWTYHKRWLPQPSDISCLANGRCMIVGTLEYVGPNGPRYPGGRFAPLVLEASAHPI